MKTRESQTVTLSRQSILLVAGVGVGLLTLSYVLGVQVGKQAVGLRRPMERAPEEDLKELPEPLLDQLKYFENLDRPPAKSAKADADTPNPAKPDEPRKAESAKPEPKKVEPVKPEPRKAEPAKPEPRKVEPAKPEPKKAEPDPKRPESPKPDPKTPSRAEGTAQKWTLQLVSTADQDEIDRLVAKAKAAGFGTHVTKNKGLLKLRITQADTYEKISEVAGRLKDAGFKPFPVKVE